MRMSKGKKPVKQSNEPQEGFLPYVDIQAFEKGKIASYANGENCLSCEDGDVLVVCDGSRSGLVGFAIKGYAGSTLAIISAEGMLPKYLYYFMQSLYPLLNTRKKGTGTPHLFYALQEPSVYIQARDQATGTAQKTVGLAILRRLNIPYIKSIKKQEQIAAKIEASLSVCDQIDQTVDAALQQAEALRQSILKKAFEGGL